MIKFTCKHCDHQLKVSDRYAGIKAKCPQCKHPLIVPENSPTPKSSSTIKFKCPHCSQKIGVKAESAGKRVRCAKCKQPLTIPTPQDVTAATVQQSPKKDLSSTNNDIGPEDLFEAQNPFHDLLAAEEEAPALKLAPIKDPPVPAESVYEESPFAETSTYQDEKEEGKRTLPWFIDMLLYPVSLGGLVNVGIYILGQTFAPLFCCMGWVVQLVLTIFIHWYFCECVRDSADGGLRAPDTVGRQDSLIEMFLQMVRISLGVLIYLYSSVMLYRGFLFLSDSEPNPIIIATTLALGGFLFPMAMLGVSILESIEGLNPILIIRSVACAFLPYCGLVLLFYGLIVAYFLLIAGASLTSMSLGGPIASIITMIILRRVMFFWALLVSAHILGRFYWRYEERMGW